MDSAKEVIHDYLKIGDFTLFQGDAEMYFKAKYEKREFHNGHDIRISVYVWADRIVHNKDLTVSDVRTFFVAWNMGVLRKCAI